MSPLFSCGYDRRCLFPFLFSKGKRGLGGKELDSCRRGVKKGEEEQSGPTHSVGATGARGGVVMESPAGETWTPGSRPLDGHLLRWLVVAGRLTPRSCDL